MKRRVFITGTSAVTACGMDLESTWQSIVEGKTGIAPIESWALNEWEYQLGGELKGYQPRKMLPDRKLLKVISRQDVIGINAACQAVDSSGLITFRDNHCEDIDNFNDKTGVYVASPGNKYCQQYDFLPLIAKAGEDMGEFANNLFETVHPMWLLRILPNNVLAYTGISYGFKGANHNVTNHAVSSTQAMLEAYHAIQQGIIDRAVVVGYDLGLEPQGLMMYSQLGLISKEGLKPFHAHQDGTILAEGAAAILLESEDAALQREASKQAEILPGLSCTEGGGVFAIDDSAESLARLISQTLTQNHLNASDIGMITAHGNGNKKSDETEAMAIAKIFGNQQPVVTSFKWATGHTIAASGLVDSVLTTKAIANRKVPGISNLNHRASYCQNLNIHNSAQVLDKPVSLLINRGFGAMNASLVIKACE